MEKNKTTRFKFLEKGIEIPYEFNRLNGLVQLEIAYQLKRIADKLSSGEQQ